MDDKRKRLNGVGGIPSVALSYLRKAGWTPKRVVSTSLYEQACRSEGRVLLPRVKHFLRNYGA
jgi:hypothetical protein